MSSNMTSICFGNEDFIPMQMDNKDIIVFGHDEYIPMQYVDTPTYEGETTVTPTTSAVTLETAGMIMSSDITVNAIPRVDTQNAYGTTVTIGG